MNMRRYDTKLYQDEDHIPACYGRSWESEDEDCEGCQLEARCRHETMNKSYSSNYKAPDRKVEVNKPNDIDSAAGKIKNNGIVQFNDGVLLMPTEDEGWVPTLGKNVLAGSLAAMGKEVFRFFSRYRFR